MVCISTPPCRTAFKKASLPSSRASSTGIGPPPVTWHTSPGWAWPRRQAKRSQTITRSALAERAGPSPTAHRRKRVGSVGLETFALVAVLLDVPPCALRSQLEAVDEGHTRFRRKSTGQTDHAEAVAPVAEVPCLQLLAMEVVDIGVCLAVLAGLVAELSEVRVPCNFEQFGFSTRRLGLGFYDLGYLEQGQFSRQESFVGIRAMGQACRGLQGLAGLAGRAAHLTGHPCGPIVEAPV